jgi:hypothetical protein
MGYWICHRGQLLICPSNDIGGFGGFRKGPMNPKGVADQFASDLLLPNFILLPTLSQYRTLNLKTVREIAEAFKASLTATAIKLFHSNKFHAMLVCHGKLGRVWFLRPLRVPERRFPRDDLDRESYAFEALFGNLPDQVHPRKIGADAWFDRAEAQRYEMFEHTFPLPNDQILTLLTFTDEGMIEERSGSSSSRR